MRVKENVTGGRT